MGILGRKSSPSIPSLGLSSATQVDQDWQEALKYSGIKIGANENLSSEDLSGRDLSGVNLTDANLTDADLTDANLNGAKLVGANLNGAKLNQIEENNIIRSQIKLACNWENAFFIFREVSDESGTRRELDAEANQNYIDQLDQDQASDPQEPVDCSRWE